MDSVPPPQRLEEVSARIAAAARAAGRDPGDIVPVAVSKRQPRERIDALIAAGHRVFGESRVVEAGASWPSIRERLPDVRLHMVGPLQTNKALEAVALFDVIHSLDRPRLAAALARACERTGRRPQMFVQVNTGEEPQKSGVAPAQADAFVAEVRDVHGFDLVGLMALPPQGEPAGPHFALLADIAARNGLAALSMGMSGDFETAIRLGATHVRLGTALFGPRQEERIRKPSPEATTASTSSMSGRARATHPSVGE